MAQLYTDLVRPARVQLDQDEAEAFGRLEHSVIQNGLLGPVRSFSSDMNGVGFTSLYSRFTSRPEVFEGIP